MWGTTHFPCKASVGSKHACYWCGGFNRCNLTHSLDEREHDERCVRGWGRQRHALFHQQDKTSLPPGSFSTLFSFQEIESSPGSPDAPNSGRVERIARFWSARTGPQIAQHPLLTRGCRPWSQSTHRSSKRRRRRQRAGQRGQKSRSRLPSSCRPRSSRALRNALPRLHAKAP